MSGQKLINLDQPPRWDGDPGTTHTEDPGPLLKALAEWAERIRRRLQRLVVGYYSGTATYDPPNLADGAGATTTVTVSGATLSDVALCSFSLDTQGVILFPWVSAADTVSVRFQNESGGAVDLASGTLSAWSFTPPGVA